ncbi:MAG TPA: DEAD/DEAH box helicase [Candidatus Dormibacteraeota bacterium]|nr:DEAD/DEAH box helicase [Candidatus Dormibacteraeota bacterium]
MRAPARLATSVSEKDPSPALSSFIERIRRSEKFGDDVVFGASVPAVDPSYALLSSPLPAALDLALHDLGILRLYSHQADAIDRVRSGEDVLTVTPTASGKSLVYLLPTLETVLKTPGARALYLFPYKALAQDQLQGIAELADAVARHGGVVPGANGLPGTGRPVVAAIYDGDTPDSRRRKIKADPPDILITNPDMLHLGILAHHHDWRLLFENLSYVVLDELHVYRGIFGSHLHHILKRLLRVAEHYGSRPRFIASSASIANPGGLGEALTGRRFAVVDRSGAPRAERHLLFLNPRGSPYTAATQLLAWSLDEGYRAIAFTKARKITELLHSWLLQGSPRHAPRVSAYRSGYLPEERREIERRLFSGSLQGVISTSALELGVDIGGLDVCLLVGYPGSVVSTWQRIGRVGREDRPSLTVLVGMPDALDQYFMTNPEELLKRGFEEVVFDPNNPIIARAHLLCAGAELPLEEPRDRQAYGPLFSLVQDLEREGALARDANGDRWFTLRRRPQRDISLRSIGATYTIVDEAADRVIGTIDAVRAFHETHAGAVYLHRGQQYLVRELLIEARRVRVVPVDVDYYTEVRGEKETEILQVLQEKRDRGIDARLGTIQVTEELTGYEKRRLFGRDRLGLFDLDLPPLTFETVGLWITLPDVVRDRVVASEGHFMGGIHALEHALISLFPLLAICDRGDIGGISYPLHPQIGRSAIFIYDGHPGGVGLAARGFEGIADLLGRTAALLRTCPCASGCPSCIQSPKCGNGNNPLDKRAALLIAEALLQDGPRPEEAPSGPPVTRRAPPAPGARRTQTPAPRAETPSGRAPLRLMGGGFEYEPLPTPARRGSGGAAPGQELTLFLDVETQKSAEEVGGWQNVADMKLALAVTYNAITSQFKTYAEKDVDRLLLDLVMADRVIGYNIDRFDMAVLKAYTQWNLARVRTFDMLADIYRKLGFRLKLGDLAGATLGVGKSSDGLQSLKWWKEGRVDLIEQYCRRDVEVTRDVFLFGTRNGYVLYRDRDDRQLRLPVDWK